MVLYMLNEVKNQEIMNKYILISVLLFVSIIVNSQDLSYNLLKSINEFDIEEYDTALVYASKVNDASIVKQALNIKAKSLFELKQYDKALIEFLKLKGKYEKQNSIFIARIYANKKDWDNTNIWLIKHLKSEYKLNPGLLKTDKFFTEFSATKQWQEIWMKDWYTDLDDGISEIQYLAYKKKFVDALDASDEILQDKKDCYKVYFERARIYKKLDDIGNEVYSLKNAVKYAPDNAKYSFEYAKALMRQGKYKKAIQEFNKTTELDKYYPRLDYFMALSYFRYTKYEEAEKYITRYRKIMPNNDEAIWLAGHTFKEKGDYEKAIEVFNVGIKNGKQIAGFYIGKGESLYKIQKYGEAINSYTMALDLEPRNGSIYYMRGMCYIDYDNKTAACRDWQKASKLGHYKSDDMISVNCQ